MNQQITARPAPWGGDPRRADKGPVPLDALQDRRDPSELIDMIGVVWRSRRFLAVWIGLIVALAVVYLYRAVPEYVATTQIVLEARRQPLSATEQAGPPPSFDSAQADSQIQVVKSERNLRFVFDTLDLAHDPDFAPGPPGLTTRLSNWLFGEAPSGMTPDEAARQANDAALLAFANRVAVKRVGQSYVLEVSFRAIRPDDAARFANAVSAAYIRDQVNFRAASVQRGTEYLQNRIADIKTELDVATQAVKSGTIPDFQFVDSDARIVSAALQPLGKSYPQTLLILVFAVAFALMTGIATVLVRHALDRVVRSRERLIDATGLDCIGVLPRMKGLDRRSGSPMISLRTVLDQPDATFARMLRVVRAALFASLGSDARFTVGITSCMGEEGRSSVAANLAFLMAASNDKVVLIDGDLSNPALSRRLAPAADTGLAEFLMGEVAEGELPAYELDRGLMFIPALGEGRQSDPNAFIGARSMRQLLSSRHTDRDIIIDLPPLSRSADAQVIGHFVDGIILLVDAGRTSLDQVLETLHILRVANVPLLGIVLNKVA